MKLLAATLLAFASLSIAHAQTPAAPQGATGMCKDGSYSTAASKRGACAGHKGVKDWYAAADAATPATTSTATPPSAAAGAPVPSVATTTSTKTASTVAPAAPVAPTAPTAPSPKAASKTPTVAAAGGGNGQVWVNTSTKVYHCEGDRYYGKTKAGSYMTEAAATAAGDRAANGKACKTS